jgi:hypothetical protein
LPSYCELIWKFDDDETSCRKPHQQSRLKKQRRRYKFVPFFKNIKLYQFLKKHSIPFQYFIRDLGYSDLSVKDRDNKLPHEVTLATYSKSRARIMEILKEEYLERLSKK